MVFLRERCALARDLFFLPVQQRNRLPRADRIRRLLTLQLLKTCQEMQTKAHHASWSQSQYAAQEIQDDGLESEAIRIFVEPDCSIPPAKHAGSWKSGKPASPAQRSHVTVRITGRKNHRTSRHLLDQGRGLR